MLPEVDAWRASDLRRLLMFFRSMTIVEPNRLVLGESLANAALSVSGSTRLVQGANVQPPETSGLLPAGLRGGASSKGKTLAHSALSEFQV